MFFFSDFEGRANVKRIEIQWLKDAMPKRVDFVVNEKIVAASTLHDSSQEFNKTTFLKIMFYTIKNNKIILLNSQKGLA